MLLNPHGVNRVNRVVVDQRSTIRNGDFGEHTHPTKMYVINSIRNDDKGANAAELRLMVGILDTTSGLVSHVECEVYAIKARGRIIGMAH